MKKSLRTARDEYIVHLYNSGHTMQDVSDAIGLSKPRVSQVCKKAGVKTNYVRHGHVAGRPSRTYKSWDNAKQRTTNPNRECWKDYGGRGITMCQEWMDDFSTFLRDMGERPEGLELDRIDNDGNYCKENCRWVTHTENINNRGRK